MTRAKNEGHNKFSQLTVDELKSIDTTQLSLEEKQQLLETIEKKYQDLMKKGRELF